jgi:hypothetical protein
VHEQHGLAAAGAVVGHRVAGDEDLLRFHDFLGVNRGVAATD